MLRTTLLAAATVALMTMAGCGRAGTGSTMPTSAAPEPSATSGLTPSTSGREAPPTLSNTAPPTLSSTVPPTLRPPTAPPRTPTDLLPTNLIVGTVTTGGTGPCYAMETNDGKQYALYGDQGTTLARGDTVRVWFEPFASSCAPGTSVRIVKLEIVR